MLYWLGLTHLQRLLHGEGGGQLVQDLVGGSAEGWHLDNLWDLTQLLQPAALHQHTEADEAILAERLAQRLGGASIASSGW